MRCPICGSIHGFDCMVGHCSNCGFETKEFKIEEAFWNIVCVVIAVLCIWSVAIWIMVK